MRNTKAFKNLRSVIRDSNHFIIRATLNTSQFFTGVDVDPYDTKILKIQNPILAVKIAIGYRLLDSLKVIYPNYSVITTDKELLDAIVKKEFYTSFLTKYLRGRWCYNEEPFEMFFLGSGKYPIHDFLSDVIGATTSFAHMPSWPVGRHEIYLVLSCDPIDNNIAKELSTAKDADMFERTVINSNALLIFPEFDESLMLPEWERDSIFADHYYEPSIGGMPSSIHDIYFIGNDKGIIDIINRLELP